MQEIFCPQNKKLQYPEMHQSAQNCERERRVPSQGSGCISPLTQLPSPSLVAARAYASSRYQKPIGWKVDAWSQRGSLTQIQQSPRRHSALVTLAESTTSLDTTPAPTLKIVSEIQLTNEQLEESETRFNAAGSKGASAIGTSITRRHSETPKSFTPVHRVPFQYTHDRLQTWGHAYFGNVVTADAFVNAVSLRRPSLVVIKEQDVHESFRSSDHVTIRARVLPKGVERKPFLIQRQFNIEELRDSIPITRPSQNRTRESIVRRSSRLRRLSLQQIPPTAQHGNVQSHFRQQIKSNHVAIPIRKYLETVLYFIITKIGFRYRVCFTLSAGFGRLDALRTCSQRRFY